MADGVRTLDQMASGQALTTRLALDGGALRARAESGDETVRVAIAEAGRALGLGLATLLHVVNPERVAIGGGLTDLPRYLEAAVQPTSPLVAAVQPTIPLVAAVQPTIPLVAAVQPTIPLVAAVQPTSSAVAVVLGHGATAHAAAGVEQTPLLGGDARRENDVPEPVGEAVAHVATLGAVVVEVVGLDIAE